MQKGGLLRVGKYKNDLAFIEPSYSILTNPGWNGVCWQWISPSSRGSFL